MKIVSITLICLILISCSKNKTKEAPKVDTAIIVPGQTTQTQLIALKGQPDKQEQALLRPDAQNAKYQNTTYEIVDGKVNATFRDPEGDEINIQYWLQKWNLKKFTYTTKELIAENIKKANPDMQSDTKDIIYTSTEDHISVIFSTNNEKVIRVIEYAK